MSGNRETEISQESMISIVLTCYNQGKYLKDSLNSLLSQSLTSWECIIVNDGSTDQTETIALEYCTADDRFRYLHQENKGVSSARNLGIENCKGDFIQFLDADDIIHPDKLKTQVGILNSNDKIDVIYGCSRYFFDQNPETLYPLHFRGSIPCDLTYKDQFQVEMLLMHNICTNCSALMRKKVVEKVRFREKIFEDWIFNLECALNGFVFHFDNSFSSYSYIRMTDSSQMMKHTNQVSEIRNLKANLFELVSAYNYTVSEKIVVPEISSFSDRVINVIRAITPPVIFSIGGSIKRRVFF